MASLYRQLKRRHVFKVAASYAMVSWLLIQIVVAVKAPLDLPPWSDTAVIVTVAVGFPIALVLAWIYDITAMGIRRTDSLDAAEADGGTVEEEPRGWLKGRIDKWSLAIAASAGTMLLATTLYLVITNYSLPITTLAVLPFNNESNDPATRHLGEGITDSVITRLSRIPQLRVKYRAAARAPNEDLKTLGKLLGVGAICFGRLTEHGKTLSITAKLVDTSDGTVLWSERFDRQASRLLTVETDVSVEIVKQLRLRLSGDEQKVLAQAPTENAQAHDLYLQGRYFWNRRSRESLARSIELYQRAIDLDPDYALAWSGLADAYLMQFGWGFVPISEAAPRVREAAQHALKLDPSLAEPHATLGYLKTLHDWDWDGARREFQHAIERNPSYSTAHHWYAYLLATLGHMDAAVQQVESARNLEPLSPIITAEVGYFYIFDRKYDRSIKELNAASQLDPSYPPTLYTQLRAYALSGQKQKARDAYRRWKNVVGDDPVAEAYGAMALPRIGYRDEAQHIYDALVDQQGQRYVQPGLAGVLAASLGDNDAAFKHFADAVRDRSLIVSWLRDPLLDKFRKDPRYAALMAQLGLSAQQSP